MRLDRKPLLEALRQFVLGGSGIIIGQPGVGKTFLLKLYCQGLLDARVPCLYLPIDKLGANSEADLRAELGIQTDLATFLRSQERSSEHPPTLVIDAFDAARSEFAQRFVLGVVRRVREALGDHWRIIVSVRIYDAKKSLALQELFPTAAPAAGSFQDPAISCRHFMVPLLSEGEVAHAVESIAGLPPVYTAASPQFRALLQIPFNLWLVERLMAQLESPTELTSVHSEIQLLNLFWLYRIRRAPDATGLMVVLTQVAARMVDERTLAVRVEDVYPLGASATWDSLLSSEVLQVVQPGASERQRVIFSHNVLFDYAVSVLLMEDEAAAVCAFLAEDASRPLFLRPSVDYYFTRLWHVRPRVFWDVLWFMLEASEAHVRVYARLVPTTVMAREGREADEFMPLLDRLANGDRAAARAMLHLLQVVRGLFGSQRDALWAELLRGATGALRTEFAWELSALAIEILDRSQRQGLNEIVDACADVGRGVLRWVWSERSVAPTAFLDQVGGAWGVRLVCRTLARAPSASVELLRPILAALSDPSFPIQYFSRLTDEVPWIWDADPEFAIDIYAAAFSYEEKSEAQTSFGTPILPLASTRRQDFQMCQYHLTRHYNAFLSSNPIAAARAAIRALNAHVMRRHVVRFLNPGFSVADVTEQFQFRGRAATYIRDLSHSWEAGHRDEPIAMADQLFGRIEAAATGVELELLDQLLDVLADEVQAAFFWKRLLQLGANHPAVFAARLFELAVAVPVVINAETLEALGGFLETAPAHLDETQRAAIEQRVLALANDADEEKAEWHTRRRNRLLSRLKPELLSTEDAKAARQQLEATSGLVENTPLVRFGSAQWRGYSEKAWLQDEGADPTREENKRLLEATKPLDQFAAEWRNARPGADAIRAVRSALDDAFSQIRDDDKADQRVREMAWTRAASAAEAVARGLEADGSERDAYELAKRILLTAVEHDPAPNEPGLDESYTSASWSASPATEAAQGIPWLLRLRADDDLELALEALSRDSRPWVRFLTTREIFRLVRTCPNLLWRIAEERARVEVNAVVQDALCRMFGDLLPPDEARVVPLLSMLAKRIDRDDRDSDALRSLIDIAMWLALARENGWAIEYLNGVLTEPEGHSYALSHAVSAAVEYVTPDRIGTDRAVWSTRAVDWLRRALDATASGLREMRARAGDAWDEATTERVKRLYGVSHEVAMRFYFAVDPKFDSSHRGGKVPTEQQLAAFYGQVKPLIEQVLLLAQDASGGMMVASTAHYFMEFFQQTLVHDPRGVLHLAALVARVAEGGGYHLDSMAAKETVELADRILADYRSELKDPAGLDDMVQLLDMFAKVGWPDALALLWRLDEVFR